MGPVQGIEPATSRSAVKRSTDWANPAAVKLYFKFSVLFPVFIFPLSVLVSRSPFPIPRSPFLVLVTYINHYKGLHVQNSHNQ